MEIPPHVNSKDQEEAVAQLNGMSKTEKATLQGLQEEAEDLSENGSESEALSSLRSRLVRASAPTGVTERLKAMQEDSKLAGHYSPERTETMHTFASFFDDMPRSYGLGR